MIQDLWLRRDGQHSKRWGRGKRWRVVVSGWPSVACRTRDEAEWENAKRITTKPRETTGETVNVAVAKWLAGKSDLSKEGYFSMRNSARIVCERWGSDKAEDLDRRDVQAWLSGLTKPDGKPYGESARSKVKVCLKGALGIDGLTVAKPRIDRREPVFLTVSQLSRLADATGRWAPMVWLLGTTGIRCGECCRLNVGDIDARRRRLRVREAKNGHARDVPIPASVLGMLDLSRDDDEPLFPQVSGAREQRRQFSNRVFRPAADSLGLTGMHAHDLRHTAASLAIASGADVLVVQRMLGHSSAAMTLGIYSHLWDGQLDKVADMMDAKITQSIPRPSD